MSNATTNPPVRTADIALLIPVFKDQAGLERTLQSLGGQGIAFDIVIVDDGSPTPITAPAEAAGQRVVLLPMPANGGITKALNFGLAHIRAQGYPFTARLDAGDTLHPGRLLAQFEAFRDNPALQLCGCYVRYVNPDGTEVGIAKVPLESDEIRNAIHYRTAFFHPTVMFRTAVFDSVGVYNETFRQAQDYELFMRIVKRFETRNLPVAYVDYELADDAISTRQARKQAKNIVRACLMNFRPLYWGSYFGVLRRLPNLVLERRHTMKLKSLLRIVR